MASQSQNESVIVSLCSIPPTTSKLIGSSLARENYMVLLWDLLMHVSHR